MNTDSYVPGQRFYADYQPRISQHKTRQGEAKRFTFIINTGTEDRHRTVIEPSGIDFSSFMRNGVVLFNHDMDKVIGRALNVFLRGDQLIAEMEFDEEDEFARGIKSKVERGFINATSIGFIPKEMDFGQETDPVRITDSELIEFSIVSVPSNREALVLERDAMKIKDLQEEVQLLRSDLAQLRQEAPEGDNPSLGDDPSPQLDASPVAELESDEPAPDSDDLSPAALEGDMPPEDALGALELESEPPATAESDDLSPQVEDAAHDEEAPLSEAASSLEAPAPRMATAVDYALLKQELMPLIRKQVRRSMGKE